MPRVLLLLPTRTYRSRDFLAAAKKLGLEVTVASEEASTMAKLQPDALLTLDFSAAGGAVEVARAFARRCQVDAVLGVDEPTVVAAARISQELGLPHHSVAATEAAKDKSRMRAILHRAGVAVPGFRTFSLDQDPAWVDEVSYPCVLKPLVLSASRGVMRADDPARARACFFRLKRLMDTAEIRARRDPAARVVLVEDFVPGIEVALEGLASNGELHVLALFDKPDPLDGPFFPETIYVTPSRLTAARQAQIAETTAAAARALGLAHGPLHAELRLNESGVFVLEAAGRTIGGLCSRSLRFGAGTSLEEIVLRHALALEIPTLRREASASGVLMLPVPRAGTLRAVHGLASARAVDPSIDLQITAHPGQTVLPLPEGDAYLGFVFARADSPDEVERLLRATQAELRFTIEP